MAEDWKAHWLPRIDRAVKEIGSALTEAAVLVLVFGLLDYYMESKEAQAANPDWTLQVWAIGLPMLFVGILIKVWSRP